MTDKKLHTVLSVLLLALMLLIPALPATAQQALQPFQQLTQRFRSGQVFKADFTHHYEDSYTGDTSTQSGQIWIGEEEYKIESPSQRVAVNGQVSRVYDSERNRLIISTYVPEEDDFAPSRILNGVDSTYSVDQQQKRGDGYFIRLSSDDPFAMFREVEITLDAEGVPQKIFVVDTAENRITTTFSEGGFTGEEDGVFTLSYPEDAEIIDMRD